MVRSFIELIHADIRTALGDIKKYVDEPSFSSTNHLRSGLECYLEVTVWCYRKILDGKKKFGAMSHENPEKTRANKTSQTWKQAWTRNI